MRTNAASSSWPPTLPTVASSGGTNASPTSTRYGIARFSLGEDLFNEIIQHPVPLDINILTALKRSALGLDLYLWLNYRIFALRVPLRLSWPTLYRQFGTEPDKADNRRTVDDFRKDCLRELKKIKLAWPDLHYATAKGVLILYPSKPAIAPTTGPQRLA